MTADFSLCYHELIILYPCIDQMSTYNKENGICLKVLGLRHWNNNVVKIPPPAESGANASDVVVDTPEPYERILCQNSDGALDDRYHS